ncbi:MAG TPA: amino acid adenylation domain-containing protein [Actinospica sp.]|nr:amino acid adenylation domain-containing protein [Actinospica sp.]
MDTGIWLNEQLGNAYTTYHLPLTIAFDGVIDAGTLQLAVNALVERHPVLGMAVEERDGVPRLVPSKAPDLNVIDLVDESSHDELIREEISRPFNLHEALARLTLIRIGSDRSVLLLVAHHLIFDGESKGVFVRDLSALYTAFAGAADATLPSLPEVEATEGDLEAARGYWESRYTAPVETILPGAVSARQQADVGVVHEFELDIAFDASKLGASRFEVFLGALAALLHRYGNHQATIAIDLTTRTAATRERIGVFVNELPITVAPAGSFRQLIAGLRADLRRLYEFRDVPLARVVTGLAPATALAPVLLSYSFRAEQADFAGTAGSVDWVTPSGASRNLLRLQITDTPTSTTLSLQGSAGLLTEDDVRRIAAHFRTLLAAATGNADSAVSDLAFLPPDERDLLARSAIGPSPGPARGTLPQIVAQHAAATPDRIAVIDGDRRLTYGQLDALADTYARRLANAGAGPAQLVAVRAEPSLELVAGLLGIMKTGAAYLPLDLGYPAERVKHVVDDARPALTVASGAIEGADEPVEIVGPALGDRAYVIYTSGSTGRPKGVEICHSSLMNLLDAVASEIGSTSEDVWLASTSLAFDISALELFLPLATGARLVIAGTGGARDGEALAELIRDQSVTHVQATPSGWRILLESGFDGRADIHALAGGEALPLPLARDLRARVARLWNVYGPTETTIWSTIAEVRPDDVAVSIGRPLAATSTYVLDDALRPMPVGIPGELYIGGAGLARGYLGRPELTRERFVPDPFGAPGKRLYRTGDRVRREADGRLTFLGRLDDQIKLRGHRIEPGEIESALLSHPGVRQAAVVLRHDDPDHPALVGYIVADAPPGPDEDALRAHLARLLPAAMLPSRFVTCDAFPRTPNGKLDRTALPAPARVSTPSPRPDDALAREIREIWQEVLRLDDIGPEEDLFDLGGHSLTVTQINARIHQRLGVRLPLNRIFDHPTIAETVEAVAAIKAAPAR